MDSNSKAVMELLQMLRNTSNAEDPRASLAQNGRFPQVDKASKTQTENGGFEFGENNPQGDVDKNGNRKGPSMTFADACPTDFMFGRPPSRGYTVFGGRPQSPPPVRPPVVEKKEEETEWKSDLEKKKARKQKKEQKQKHMTDEIPGFRGNQSIDSLLAYIEGDDKDKNKKKKKSK